MVEPTSKALWRDLRHVANEIGAYLLEPERRSLTSSLLGYGLHRVPGVERLVHDFYKQVRVEYVESETREGHFVMAELVFNGDGERIGRLFYDKATETLIAYRHFENKKWGEWTWLK